MLLLLVISVLLGVQTSSFDLENRRQWTEDVLGRRTSFQYDDVGRLRFTIQPDATPATTADNPYTETVYDLAGRVTDAYDELRHRTRVTYYPDGTPDAGRLPDALQNAGFDPYAALQLTEAARKQALHYGYSLLEELDWVASSATRR